MSKQTSRKWWLGFTFVTLAGFVLAACAPAPTPETIIQEVVVTQIVEIEGEQVVVTQVVEVEVEVPVEVEVEVEVVVTATAAPIETPRVALIMSGQREDQSWNQFMADSVQRLVDGGVIEASFAEDIAPADFERVAADYAEQGYDLIVAHTSDYTEAAIKVATDYPEVNFAVTGGTQYLPNMAGLNNWTHGASAVAGYLAANLTESNTVGIIGAFAFPTQFVAHEGFKYGVFRANGELDEGVEQVSCLETFTNTWFDTALGFEAAIAQMDQGADYIYITTSGAGFGVIQAAQETGNAKVIGSFTDMNPFAEDVVITSVERLADAPLEAILFDIRSGRFTGKDYAFNLANGGTALSPYHGFESEIPADVQEKVATFQQNVIDGRIRVPFVTAKLGGETGCTT